MLDAPSISPPALPGAQSSPVGPVATVVRRRLDSALTPERVLLALRHDPLPFALVGSWAGGGAIVGSQPVCSAGEADDPFSVLDSLPVVEAPSDDATPPSGVVGGGWFGWLGYQLGGRLERLPPAPPRPTPLPAAHLAFYDHLLRFDASSRSWWFEALWTPARAQELARRAEYLGSRLGVPRSPPGRRWSVGSFRPEPDGADHQAAVAACLDHISAGDVFQANVCLRLDAAFAGDPLDVFTTAAPRLRPRYGAFFTTSAGAVASFSPELFLRRVGTAVHTRPIKGTAPRTGSATADSRSRRALLESAKDRAENVMIVDLMRNDLGRVCAWGSVRVPALARLEAHPGVWHLVSEVAGQLRPGVSHAGLLRATFPPGSVTGAPKVRAMEVVAALEATAREVYTGCTGYVSPVAGLELAVAIRTLELSAGRAWLGAGGGIVAGSRPERELEECLVKARPLVAAVRSSIEAGRPSGWPCGQDEGV